MIVELLGLVVVVFSLHQIFKFYNIQSKSMAIYIAFYVFMGICVFLYPGTVDAVEDIHGYLSDLDLATGTAKTRLGNSDGVSFYDDKGNTRFVMRSVPPSYEPGAQSTTPVPP